MVFNKLGTVGTSISNSSVKSGLSGNTQKQAWKDLSIFDAAEKLGQEQGNNNALTFIQMYNTDANRLLISEEEYKEAEAALKQQGKQGGGLSKLFGSLTGKRGS